MNAINENKTNAKDKAVKRIVKRSKRKQKPYNELSRSEQCRRRKHVEKIAPVAGYFSRNKLQKRIIDEHPKQQSVKVNDKFEVKFFDFGELLEHDLKTIGVEELPSHLTIVLSGDYGNFKLLLQVKV
uniref:Uncharacterized protein n=1 Tax=Panagrolaimus superbus TaxID=310955 RepID=A0A914YNJ3_9BILA